MNSNLFKIIIMLAVIGKLFIFAGCAPEQQNNQEIEQRENVGNTENKEEVEEETNNEDEEELNKQVQEEIDRQMKRGTFEP